VERAGIAPVLWLVEARGYTLDRVAVPTASPDGLPTRVPLAGGGELEAVVAPIPVSERFPERAALATTAVPIRVLSRGAPVFEGLVRPGQPIALGDRVLTVQEVRYWAGLRLVSEDGGGLLVAGFVLSVLGIVWRMVWYRREVAVAWDARGVTVAGRCEFFPARFREELGELAGLLGGAPRAPGRKDAA
jgi:hypothetical protein